MASSFLYYTHNHQAPGSSWNMELPIRYIYRCNFFIKIGVYTYLQKQFFIISNP